MNIESREDELIEAFERWRQKQEQEPTFFDVMRGGSSDVAAGYLLHQSRTAGGAIVGMTDAEERLKIAEQHRTAKMLGAFGALADRWGLSHDERLRLLGLASTGELEQLITLPLRDVPLPMLERIDALFRIAQSFGPLRGGATEATDWVRLRIGSPPFDGESPLLFMMRRGLEGIRATKAYLAEVIAEGGPALCSRTRARNVGQGSVPAPRRPRVTNLRSSRC